MEELNTEVLRGFGIRPRKIFKEKNYYICLSAEGAKQIYMNRCSTEQVEFQHYVKELLASCGFEYTDRYYLSLTGEPYVCCGGDVFTMTDPFNSPDGDFSDAENFLEIVSSVAGFHFILKETDFDSSACGVKRLNDSYQNDSNNLFRLKKMLTGKNRLSDFDVLLRKNLDSFSELTNKSYILLDKAEYNVSLRRAAGRGGICHNALKEENIKYVNENHCIINFSECGFGYYCDDLAYIIKRYYAAADGRKLPVTDITEAYRAVNPLTEQDISALYALLLYPDKFLKIVSQYNLKKRSWVPGTYIARLNSAIEAREGFLKYIEPLATAGQ